LRLAKKSDQPEDVKNLKCSLQPYYYVKVVRNLLGKSYYSMIQTISTTDEFIQDISQSMGGLRPAHRLGKPLCNTTLTAQLMDNLFQNPLHEFAVEIKPKWGWACGPEQGRCKFCRLQETSIYTVGDYCPTNVFSNDCKSIRDAVRSLYKNPRNQLRIYRNGVKIELAPENLLDRLTSILWQNTILPKIKSAQKLLFTKYQKHELDASLSNIEYLTQLKNELSNDSMSDPTVCFLSAMALEDISLVISFNLKGSPTWSVNVIDVDIKLPSKLEYYIREHDWSQA